MAEAALIAALEERPIVFEGMEDLEPADRARMLRAIERRGERVVVCAPNRNAALALGDRTFLLVEAAPPSFAERATAWSQASGTEDTRDVAAKFRLSIGQILEAAEVAKLAAAARGAQIPEPPSSTSAHARPRPRGSGSSPRGSRPASPGTTSSCPTASASCSARSAPTCATATACSPSGATRRPSPGARA